MDANGQLTFTRASSATRVGPNGYIEKVRQNVLKYSEAFDNTAQWGYSNNGTITANAIANPLNGETTADLYVVTNGAANIEKTLVSGASVFAFTAGTTYTASAYYKAGTINSQFRLLAYDGVSVQNSGIIDLVTIGNSTASYESVGDGWYRFWLTFTAQSGAGNGYIYVVNYNFVSAITNGTNVYVFGAQLEVSDFGPTPYIKTEAAAVSVGPVSGTPRLDYLGSDCPRLLLEPSRTNLISYSESFNNGYWAGSGGVTPNTAISPDGYQNADTNASGGVYPAAPWGGDATATNTASIFAKANPSGASTLRIYFNRYGFGDAVYCDYNLTNGTASAVTFVGSAVSGTAKIENYGNGWYRCILTGVVSTSAGTLSFNPINDCYIWGAQVEAAAYATSYIPTLGTSVTRVADAAFKTGISSLIGQTEGTLFVDVDQFGGEGNSPYLLAWDGTFNNRIQISSGGSGTENSFTFYVTVGGTNVVFYIHPTALTGRHKLALAYKLNDVVGYLDGVQVLNDTSATIPATSALQMAVASTNPVNAGINQALLFKTRLTNAQLAELTTL